MGGAALTPRTWTGEPEPRGPTLEHATGPCRAPAPGRRVAHQGAARDRGPAPDPARLRRRSRSVWPGRKRTADEKMSDSRANLFHGKRVTAERRTSIDDWRGSRAPAWNVPPPMERRESVTTRSHRVRIASSSLSQSSSRSVPARILFASARNRFDLALSALIRPIRPSFELSRSFALSALIRPIRPSFELSAPHSSYPGHSQGNPHFRSSKADRGGIHGPPIPSPRSICPT